MFKTFNKALLVVLIAFSFSSLVSARTLIKLNKSALNDIEMIGDVFNQTSNDIYTNTNEFPLIVRAHLHSDTSFKVSGPFTRVIYKNDKRNHGCVFEFSTNVGLGSMQVDDYPISAEDSCHVIGDAHITLIVGN